MSTDVQRRYAAFEQVWLSISERYFDPTFGKVDWAKVRTEFEPKVKAAKTDHELHNLLNQMIGRLPASHLAIVPPEVYQTIEDARVRARAREKELRRIVNGKDKEGAQPDDDRLDVELYGAETPHGLGIDLSLLDDRFIITRIDADSAAAHAGLKLGYAIEKINGIVLQDTLASVMLYYGSLRSSSVRNHVPAQIVESIINGDPDTHVEISYNDGSGTSKDIRVLREPLHRERWIVISPNFPERTLSFESRSLSPTIGYIRFNYFAAPVIAKFCAAVAEHSSKESLVIDLRGNSGGMLASLPVLLGMLSPNTVSVGTMKYRYYQREMEAPSKARHFKGKIAVLVDARTASAAEIFAIALRENNRGLIVGARTAGEALPSIAIRLSTDAVFQYPIANFIAPSGKFVEGSGVSVDTQVLLDRKLLLEGRDSQLETALKQLADPTAFAALSKPLQPPPPPTEIRLSAATPPPPPPPMKRAPASGIGSGYVEVVKEQERSFPAGHDAKTKKTLDDFFTAIGGRDAIKAITRYKLTGSTKVELSGVEIDYDVTAYRDSNDKYAEHLTSEILGELRQVTSGKTSSLQSDLGIDLSIPAPDGVKDVDPFVVLIELAKGESAFPSLSYTGEYMRNDKNTAVIEGRLASGEVVRFAFDIVTKMLVSFTGPRASISFADYRKVGSVSLPFSIERGPASLRVEEILINQAIDPSVFEKKKLCFDSPAGQ